MKRFELVVSALMGWKPSVLLGLMSPKTGGTQWAGRVLWVVHRAREEHHSTTSSAPSPVLLAAPLLAHPWDLWKERKKTFLEDFSKASIWWYYKGMLSQCYWTLLRSGCTFFLLRKRAGGQDGTNLAGPAGTTSASSRVSNPQRVSSKE